MIDLSQPRFIVLEGLDGSGKTTQANRLAGKFEEANLPHIVTRQPSNGPVGGIIRDVLRGDLPMENEAFALLFAADRFQHYHEVIASNLALGKHVICDRYYYSNMSNQGVDAAAMERVAAYNQAVMNARRPDIVFYLDIPPEECMRRIAASRPEVSIYESVEQLKIQRQRYFDAFERLSATDNIVIINASKRGDVMEQLWAHLIT